MDAVRSIRDTVACAAGHVRTIVTALVVLAILAGCGAPSPTAEPASSSPTASESSALRPTATPRPTAKPTSAPSPTLTAAPTLAPIVGATQTKCPGSAGTAHRGSVTTGLSRNWAGYVVGATRGHVTCVEGAWTQPRVSCPATSRTSVAIWVGIDGSSGVGSIPDSSATLAQTGTIADCSGGEAQYSAWYEFLPDLQQVELFHLTVAAGDKIWAQVRWLGKGKFLAAVINLTKRVGDTQTWSLRSAPLLTAEWIVEDPAASCSDSSCTFVALAHFTTATLNGAVTISGTHYNLAAIPFPYLRTGITRSGRTLATPSSLTSHGFKVTWKAS